MTGKTNGDSATSVRHTVLASDEMMSNNPRDQFEMTAHKDTFVIDHLPLLRHQPDFLFNGVGEDIHARMNIAADLVDRWVNAGLGELTAIITDNGIWSYAELSEMSNRVASVLTEDMALIPGNRVLLHAPNNPMLFAAWLGVVKAGGIPVTIMPLLRCREILPIIEKAEISHALCDARLAFETQDAGDHTHLLRHVMAFNGTGDRAEDGEFELLLAQKSGEFTPVDTAVTDPVLLAFTSGTTGKPKATIHTHRDIAAMSNAYVDQVLKPTKDDIFIGSPPIGFTFGLGGLMTFPFHVGAAVVLLEKATPAQLAEAIERHKATIVFTAPTAYRVMLGLDTEPDLSSLKYCVSAGEHLPKSIFTAWKEKFGTEILNLIGTTEMFHGFICQRPGMVKPGAVGLPMPGYEVEIFDERLEPAPLGKEGRLAVRGPTGCRYLDDVRQSKYVQNGWNITGDIFRRDADGYYWFVARADEMIQSSGYNISGVEIEAVLIDHDAVREVGVVGLPDEERGQIVSAFIVLHEGFQPDSNMVAELQDFVKGQIAPYKYPRAIYFMDALPKTATGKIQRSRLTILME